MEVIFYIFLVSLASLLFDWFFGNINQSKKKFTKSINYEENNIKNEKSIDLKNFFGNAHKLLLTEQDFAQFVIYNIEQNNTRNLFHMIDFICPNTINDYITNFDLDQNFLNNDELFYQNLYTSHIIYTNIINFLIFINNNIYNIPIVEFYKIPDLAKRVQIIRDEPKYDQILLEEENLLLKTMYLSNLMYYMSDIINKISNILSNYEDCLIKLQENKTVDTTILASLLLNAMHSVKENLRVFNNTKESAALKFGIVNQDEINKIKKIIKHSL